MGYKGFEPVVVNARQVKRRITPITRANASQPAAVNEIFPAYSINGTEIISHYLSTPILTDLLIPQLAMSIHAAAVRCHYHITVCSHELEIPAEGIGLRKW